MSEDSATPKNRFGLKQAAKYVAVFAIGAMLYDWADDFFDKDDSDKTRYQFIASGEGRVIMVGDKQNGKLYVRRAKGLVAGKDDTPYQWEEYVEGIVLLREK